MDFKCENFLNIRMGDEVFDGQILSEKLSKLNSSQQSIESLSKWCISHRKKARQVVETWDKAFGTAQRDQRVSFLYLANDILQNSRRKGSEFVNEFWKVLPATLKHVYENGDEQAKKAACRLVDIWEERKVFGSRGQNLKDEMLGKDPPPVNNVKSSNPIKIVKRDAHSLRIKLSVGGMPEKIVSAFQLVQDENINEEDAYNKCKAAATLVGKIEREVENTSGQGNQQGLGLMDEIQEQENVLKQCVRQLENAEVNRVTLVSQLKQALQEQELRLELIRTELQAARNHIEQMSNMRQSLTSPPVPAVAPLSSINNQLMESTPVGESNQTLAQPTSASPLVPPVISFAAVKTSEEESKKAAAAAVAAKLAASTSSAQMLTSVLSSLVAEEAASMSGLKPSAFVSSLPIFSPEKRQKLEKPVSVTDVNNSDMGNSGYFTPLQQQPITNMPTMPPTSMQAPLPPPPPPPLPSVLPANSPANQFVQSSGLMVGVMPYGYGANNLPPPPPLPSHIAMGLARPVPQPPQPQPAQQQQQSQQPTNGGFYRHPGIGFYGQNHQPATPPVPRQ